MITPPTSPPVQLIPPQEAGRIAIYTAATALCLAFEKKIQYSDLQGAMNRGLAHQGLRPVPPHQIIAVWGIAAILVKDPRICPLLLKP